MSQPSVASMFDPIETQPVMEPPSAKELGRLASQYLLLEAEHERQKAALAEISARKEQSELQLLDALQQSGMKSFKLDTGHMLSSCTKFRYSLPPKSNQEAREKCLKWLKRVGAKELVSEDVNYQTLGRFLRERAEAGKDVIPEIARFEQRYLSVRRES